MPLSMTTYLALLWGVSVLFSTESMSTSIPDISSINSTAEPNVTSKQLISVTHNETETEPDPTWHLTHKPAEVSVAATADTTFSTVSPTLETEEAIITHRSTTGLVVMNTVAATASSSGPGLLHTSTAETAAETTAAGEAQPSHDTAILKTIKPTEDQVHRQSPTTSTDMTAPATTSAAMYSSPQPASTTNPEVTSELSSTSTPASNSTQAAVVIQNLSSPSASATTTMTANPTSEAAPVFDPTSLHFTISETFPTSTEVSSASQPVSVTRTHISTSQLPDSAGSSSTAETPTTSFSTDSAVTTTAIVSTSSAGILIPRVPKRGQIPTPKSTPATATAPHKVSKSPLGTEVQPCSTRGIVKQCLIVIAALAGLATIFMVSTIILCAKLSARKYKVKKPQQATEMMCISALLPERNYTYTRQRNPVTNGVLVIHAGGDSDEDERDNLTLSSFLPENDRLV